MRVTLLVYTSLLQQPRDSTLSKGRAGDEWIGNSFLGRHIYSNHVLYVPTVPRLCRAHGSPQDSAPDGLSVMRAVYRILDGTRLSTMNAQQAIQWPHTTHIPLYMQHTTTHHDSTRSIDQAVHSTASTGARCAALLSLPAGRRTIHFGWYGQFCGVIRGKTTPEDIFNADTLIIYSSRVWACLVMVVAATFAVLSYNFSSVEGCLQVFEHRSSIYALVPAGLVIRGARGCGVKVVQWVRKESLFPPCMSMHVQSVNYLGTS
jgi:hypothetical protein